MMKYTVVYDSPTGNTKMLAEEILSFLGKENCLYFGEPGDVPDESGDIVFVGFWTDKGECSEKIARFLEETKNSRVVLFGTAGFGGSEDYFGQILQRVEKHLGEGSTLAGSFMCQGKMPAGVRKRYEAMLQENPGDEKIRMMIDNFDRATVHPDAQDINNFKEKLSELKIK